MRIVFADDHNLIRESVSTLLKNLSDEVDVLEAANFDEAFDKAAREPLPDLIILDLFMPGMNHLNGLDVMGKRFPGVPIVILTGAVDLNDAYTALERGGSFRANCFHCKQQAGGGCRGTRHAEHRARPGVKANGNPGFPMGVMVNEY